METKTAGISSVLLGSTVAGLLVLTSYGVLRSQDYEPSVLSTGNLDQQLLQGSYRFSYSADPGVEVLKLTSTGGMAGITTTYSLYGDGRLVWRKMANVAGNVPVIEIYDDQPVLRLVETELTFDQMRELVGIPVTHGIVESTRKQILERMDVVAWGNSDAGVRRLELNLDSYSRPGLAPATIDFEMTFSEPVDAARKYPDITPLQCFEKLVKYMNSELGLSRPR